MTFFSSLAVMAATRLGYKVAERKKWLPSSLYHQLALDKLRDGDLQQAARLNQIALQKKPNYEKALIVKDLIAMRRDALLNNLLQQINSEKTAIGEIDHQNKAVSRQYRRVRFIAGFLKFSPWMFLFINIFTYLLAYFFLTTGQRLILGTTLGGFAVVCTILVFVFFRTVSDQEVQARLKLDDLLAARKSMRSELGMRERRLRSLQSKLSETRYKLRVK